MPIQAAISPLFGGIGRDRLVGLPSGGLPLTSLASGGKRGLAQSLFQVGGNLGGSLGPLLAAVFVAPYGRRHIALFTILAFTAIMVMIPVGHWYKSFLLRLRKAEGETLKTSVSRPLPMGKTVFSIAILLILIFSKYIYMASLNSYYTFYLIHKFGVSVQASQLYLLCFPDCDGNWNAVRRTDR